jgi:hypothetical protein
MRGFSEFKGITYRLEFDVSTQSFIQKPVNITPHVGMHMPEVDGKLIAFAVAPKSTKLGILAVPMRRRAKTG